MMASSQLRSSQFSILKFQCSYSFFLAILFISLVLFVGGLYLLHTHQTKQNTKLAFSFREFFMVIGLAIIFILVGCLTLSLIQRYSNTTITPMNSSLGLIFAVLFSYLLLRETPSLAKMGGLVLMMTGIWVVLQGEPELKNQLTI